MKKHPSKRDLEAFLKASAGATALDLAATAQLHKELSATAVSLVPVARKKAARGEYQLLKILIGYSRAAARRQQADERIRQSRNARTNEGFVVR
jgi:hypothetical protein